MGLAEQLDTGSQWQRRREGATELKTPGVHGGHLYPHPQGPGSHSGLSVSYFQGERPRSSRKWPGLSADKDTRGRCRQHSWGRPWGGPWGTTLLGAPQHSPASAVADLAADLCLAPFQVWEQRARRRYTVKSGKLILVSESPPHPQPGSGGGHFL